MIGPWIAETQAKKVTAQAEIRTAVPRRITVLLRGGRQRLRSQLTRR